MPRPKDHAAPITTAVANLLAAVTELIVGVQGAVAAGAQLRNAALNVGQAGKVVGQAANDKSAKLRRALKRYWAGLKGKKRAARVAEILKGRGLNPRATARRAPRRAPSKPVTRKAAPRRRGRANPWAKMTPAQRAERVAKMRAGRKARVASPASAASAGGG